MFTSHVFDKVGISLGNIAADQAKQLNSKGLEWKCTSKDDLEPGDLIFASNGDPNGKVIDASAGRGRVVARKIENIGKAISYGRPLGE